MSAGRVSKSMFQYLLLLEIGLSCSWQYKELMIVNKGTGLDYHKLWDFTGYTCEKDTDNNFRSGLIDRPNTDGCLYMYHIIFVGPTDKSIRQTPISPKLYLWFNKIPIHTSYGISGKDITVNATSNPRMYLHDIADKDKFYLSIWYTIGSYSPRLFGVESGMAVSVTDTASYVAGTKNAPSNLFEESCIKIVGKYYDNCTPETPLGTTLLTLAECYSLIACPLTVPEQQNSRFREGLFKVSNRHSDHLPTSNIIWVKTDQSLQQCGSFCRQEANCLSFFYFESTRECHGYKHVISWTDSPKNYPGMKHFVNQYCDI